MRSLLADGCQTGGGGSQGKAAKELLRRGAEVDAVDGGGQTALHVAVRAQQQQCALQLVAGGASTTVGRPPPPPSSHRLQDRYCMHSKVHQVGPYGAFR